MLFISLYASYGFVRYEKRGDFFPSLQTTPSRIDQNSMYLWEGFKSGVEKQPRHDFKAARTWASAKPMEHNVDTASGSNLWAFPVSTVALAHGR